MAHDVFISYSTHDKLTADAICSIFEANDIRCWIAPRDILPGMDWGASIIDAIKASQVMVLILSASSNTSEQVKREVERAVHNSIIIIPFRIEDVQLSKSLEYQLSLTHWMDAITPPLESHIQLLVDEIKPLLQAKKNNNDFSEQQFTHAKVAGEKIVLEKQKEAVKPDYKVSKDSPDSIETYFYDLAKEKRISKDILIAVLALLDKEQSQLSALEQRQLVLVQELFTSKFGALDFVRKWDKLVYEIDHAERTSQPLQEKEPLAEKKLTLQKKQAQDKLEQENFAQQQKTEEKTTQEKWQRPSSKYNAQTQDLERKQFAQKYLIGVTLVLLVLSIIAIGSFIDSHYFQDTSDSDITTPKPADANIPASDTTRPVAEKKLNIEMVDIKGGCFSMGSPTDETGRYANETQHQVCVKDFQIAKYELTQALWLEVMGNNPSKYKGDNLPVEQVSWDDVQLFLTRLNQSSGENYRLPTEAEWEYAARAGTTSIFYTGKCIDTSKANYDGTATDYANCGAKTDIKVGQTTAVGTYPANPWGLYDMAGNVWEWLCSEYVENYDGREAQCVGKTANNLRALRSGAWSYNSGGVRSAIRWWNATTEHSEYIGFRLAKGNNIVVADSPPVSTASNSATSTTSSSSKPLWGSLAINKKGKNGYSYNYPSSSAADARALKECGSDCYIVKNFNGGCGAYAADKATNGDTWGWGTASTKEQAEEIALKYCRQYGGTDCVVRVQSCNSH